MLCPMQWQPSGTVTLVFTDIEGSTRLLVEMGDERYRAALAEHRRVVRHAFGRYEAYEVDYEGDAFFYAFRSAADAVAAVGEAVAALAPGVIRIRVGVHTGRPALDPPKYVGMDVHKAARIMAAAHGGQVLLSDETVAALGDRMVGTELGEHRLKDFDQPVALFQLGSERFPPLKTISNTNLPRPASSFVGREHEAAEVVSLFAAGARLVTLSGPGGTGKTRLALEAASELVSAFKAGVFWVGLAALRDPALLTGTIAQTFGARNGLAEHVAEREMLLLLDNFEQVVDAAPDLSKLLEACPNLRLLVTSRELLRISGENEYPVPPLAETEAVELFCDRSHLEPDGAITQLCRRLDDLPLAVELAAARTHVLSPAQILERLGGRLDLLKGRRDVDPRQQTLRATIDWSHDLLTGDERRLFARLAVFADGCSLDAAEDVCDADLDVLQSLVDKSLIRHTADRFWMLETIREFAIERLQSLPEGGWILERHARWYLRMAKSDGGLDADVENLRNAIGWARDHDGRLEVELVGASWHFLAARGLLREALGYLRHALETAQKLSLDETELLGGAVYVSVRTGDYADGERWGEKNLELARAAADPRAIAGALVGLALTVEQQVDYGRARALYLEGADVARDCGETRLLAVIAYNLGEIALIEGDAETARMNFQQTLDVTRELSDPGGEAFGLVGLSFVALSERDADKAAALLRSSLRLASNLGVRELLFSGLLGSAEVAVERGETARASRLLAATDALREEMGYTPSILEQNQRARIGTVLGEDDALVAAQSEGRALTLDDAVAYALEERE
jgi:predicted ATPase